MTVDERQQGLTEILAVAEHITSLAAPASGLTWAFFKACKAMIVRLCSLLERRGASSASPSAATVRVSVIGSAPNTRSEAGC